MQIPRKSDSNGAAVWRQIIASARRHSYRLPGCQRLAGAIQLGGNESGSWFGVAPNEAKALATALVHQTADRDDRALAGALEAKRVAR